MATSVKSAVPFVSADQQFSKVLAEGEASVLRLAVSRFNSGQLTPEMALAFWAQIAAIHTLDHKLERDARKAIREVENG